MTRVLFLAESFHPVLGGGERHIRMLAARLAASGMPASVLTRRTDAAWPREEELDGVRVVRVGPSGPGRGGKYAMVAPALAALRSEQARFDVLVVRGARVLGLPGLLAARVLGKPVVLQAELSGEMSGEIYTWGTPLDRPWARRLVGAAVGLRNVLLGDADAFVAISKRIVEEFRAAGVPEERLHYVPHGVDTGRYRPAGAAEKAGLRRRLGLPESGELVTYAGRLLRGKGLEVLLDAFGKAAERHPQARLVLIGSGAGQVLSVEEVLRAQAARPPLAGRVVFTGRVDSVEEYLRASDIFAFPSFFEALPLAVLEAAASGLASVATRIGGVVDVLEDGGSALLVEPGDAAAVAEALVALLADPGRRRAMGARAREKVLARFDLGESVERYRALFREVSLRRSDACWPGRAPRAGAAPPGSPAPRA